MELDKIALFICTFAGQSKGYAIGYSYHLITEQTMQTENVLISNENYSCFSLDFFFIVSHVICFAHFYIFSLFYLTNIHIRNICFLYRLYLILLPLRFDAIEERDNLVLANKVLNLYFPHFFFRCCCCWRSTNVKIQFFLFNPSQRKGKHRNGRASI